MEGNQPKTLLRQGIGSISAVLKKGGHQTDLLYLWQLNGGVLDQRIHEFKPNLIALSMTSGFFEFGCAVAKQVWERHHLPVLFGGVHPTLRPEESISVDGVFAICVDEGEYTRDVPVKTGKKPVAIPGMT
jgi:hypothetical protein